LKSPPRSYEFPATVQLDWLRERLAPEVHSERAFLPFAFFYY